MVAAVGAGVIGWQVGDQVCALLAGGGYAQRVAVPAVQVLPVPDGVDLVSAASLPEAACTVWSNLVMTADLRARQTVLIHGGRSGIGTMAIQVARQEGAKVAVTASRQETLDFCRELGAQVTIDYAQQDFVEEIRSATNGRGADIILDVVGAKYLQRNIVCARRRRSVGDHRHAGRDHGGAGHQLTTAKRAGIIGTMLRSRPVSGPGARPTSSPRSRQRLADVRHRSLRPIIGARFPVEQAQRAHELLAAGEVSGKPLLRVCLISDSAQRRQRPHQVVDSGRRRVVRQADRDRSADVVDADHVEDP